MRQSAVRRVTAVTFHDLARTHRHPVVVARRDPAAVCIENIEAEGDVGGYLHLDRTVRFDWRVADDLAHEAARAECRAVEFYDLLVGNRYGLHDTDESGGSLRSGRYARVAKRRD